MSLCWLQLLFVPSWFLLFFSYMCAICSASNGGSVARVWFEAMNSLLKKSPQPKCKPLQTSSSRFPWQLTHFLVELIALAIFFSFHFCPQPNRWLYWFPSGCIWLTAFPGWTEMTGCPFCLEHDLGLATLSLASHWSFGRLISDCVHAYLRVWQRQCGPLMWSQEAGGPEIQPDCVINLWQVTLQGKQQYI